MVAGAETRGARNNINAPRARPQGQENTPPPSGDIAQKIREMDQLACYGVFPQSAGEEQIDVGRLRELWSTLRDDILITLVQGVQAAATQVTQPPQHSQSAATPPSHVHPSHPWFLQTVVGRHCSREHQQRQNQYQKGLIGRF